MLAVMEERDYNLTEIARDLSYSERALLRERIDFGLKAFSRDRFGFMPSSGFLTSLKRRCKTI
ncbi:MAG: hypothetical protein AABX66_01195 [Nanoarchaeota archaeon]